MRERTLIALLLARLGGGGAQFQVLLRCVATIAAIHVYSNDSRLFSFPISLQVIVLVNFFS